MLLIPGAVLFFERKGSEGFAFTAGLYIVAILGAIVITVVMSISDKLNAYYGRKDYILD